MKICRAELASAIQREPRKNRRVEVELEPFGHDQIIAPVAKKADATADRRISQRANRSLLEDLAPHAGFSHAG